MIRPNLGYDWGCYQQFMNSDLWRNYETIFFIHDDVEIHDLGFIEETRKLLQHHAVIGNGVSKGAVSYASVNKHPYAYAHSVWKPETFNFQHYTVRGSYLATTRDVLEKIGSFEVFWDPFKLNIGFGNWSTKATCAKLEALFGEECFGFLSETFGKSKYITEYYRGDNLEPPDPRILVLKVTCMHLLKEFLQYTWRFITDCGKSAGGRSGWRYSNFSCGLFRAEYRPAGIWSDEKHINQLLLKGVFRDLVHY